MKFNQLNIYNYHGSEDIRLFRVKKENVKLWDDKVLVYDVRDDDYHSILRHYSFYDKWFEINCTFDMKGNLLPENGPIERSFNCDMCSPCFSFENNVYNVDLELDVLVNPNGKDYIIIDEEDFKNEIKRNNITALEEKGALAGLSNLIEIINSGELINFLNDIYPFSDVTNCTSSLPMEKLTRNEISLFEKEIRHTFYGKRRA
ncbi:DUF402 domain-containing protein [Lederbergia sp. NSJ-179]|uniref:DUF402 domain-containing protein n=1 Tax=Lederbergia sp. NSJ-179 TaxID=2931402 RepID=UPI001FD2C273|nr:DUF402 domain-containing protein [Lederbergia sp. NSJ-179]MCJ7841399.1 DUF402 domain-containing protein [Lederbergia sp. NSJ-179]